MDVKEFGRFPVYLMTDKYGARAHDYRAPNCKHGILLIVASSFPDERTRLQALLRVGRHNDNCTRVQVNGVKDIDGNANIDRLVKLRKAVELVKK